MTYSYESCDLTPWLSEIVNRMHECHAAQQPVLDLSYTHPRGFIPNQILRRKTAQVLLKDWHWTNAKGPATPMPEYWWNPYQPNVDLNYVPLDPFLKEIELREHEAEMEKRAGLRLVALTDLTSFHPRGGIPLTIMTRLARRKDVNWRKEMTAEIARLRGDANKDIGFAETQQVRAIALRDDNKDSTAMFQSVKDLKARAEASKAHAKFLESELG
jgi:hypothetical protein